MRPIVIHTFGDSVLDCARYNNARVTPVGLLVRNNNVMFAEWQEKDFATLNGGGVYIDHRATDGATADDLDKQLVSLDMGPEGFETHIAVVSIGGNDLLTDLGLFSGSSKQTYTELLSEFQQHLTDFASKVSIKMPTFMLNVYDPSFGDDKQNFLNIPEYMLDAVAPELRKRHADVNALIEDLDGQSVHVIDMHKHFLGGDPSWYAHAIEPSASGASEVRRLLYDRIAPDLFGGHL